MKESKELRGKLDRHVSSIKSCKGIYELFELLGYPSEVLFRHATKRRKSEFDFPQDIGARVKEIYAVLSFGTDLPVFLMECELDSVPFIRELAKKLSERYIKCLFIITTDYGKIHFVFPDQEKIEAGKSKLRLTRLVLDTSTVYRSDLDTLVDLRCSGREKSYRDIWRKWREAFSVSKVTKAFFDDYKNNFFHLREKIEERGISIKEAHEFTLQFLSRMMFIYFISKKGWLNDNPKFLKWYWDEYKRRKRSKQVKGESFYKNWLEALFFKAFCNRGDEIKTLPKEIKDVIQGFPHLNGGLFLQSNTDKLGIELSDSEFESTFKFFEDYNFTIREDMPLESEVAVDPQMIGYVYESLANIAEEIYDRKDMGIFYTPRVEVEFMCRRTLIEYLAKHLPDVPKEEFYRFVFDEKEKAEKYFTPRKLWNKLEYVLDNLSVIDPACGSGAFLVGMLNILVELYRLIYKHVAAPYANRDREFDFNLKKRIINQSLYGVDVMPWAVQAAELRLWLQMIIHSEFPESMLRSNQALLPNLNLNIRQGDSLVQEIGGVKLNLRGLKVSGDVKRKLDELKIEKRDYFRGQSDKYRNAKEFRAAEAEIFSEIIRESIAVKKTEKEKLLRTLSESSFRQVDLLSGEAAHTGKAEIDNLKARVDQIKSNIIELKAVLAKLDKTGDRDFVWEIDFAEVFSDKGGFDIVIGNPPYVRQEKISPPNLPKAEVTKAKRKKYKDDLESSVLNHFPEIDKIDKKSDYYIYFFYHGLALLNPDGYFCFITSNSWLDVGYGKGLQEFLLKYVKIIGIFDCRKRTFEHADINTVISIFSAPCINKSDVHRTKRLKAGRSWPCLSNTAKFVMFEESFDIALQARVLSQIENTCTIVDRADLCELAKNIPKDTKGFRVFPILQEDLLQDGWEYTDVDFDYSKRFQEGRYFGNKWGGKYLRAPDIFYIILSKGENKLLKLKSIAQVRRGPTTGCNEFFFLDKDKISNWNIEQKYLKPVIKSPKECTSYFINPLGTKYQLLMCNQPISALKGKNIHKYIKWGEKQKNSDGVFWHNVPSVSGRHNWYSIGKKTPAIINFNYLVSDYGTAFYGKVHVSDNFHEIHTDKRVDHFLNSTISWLFQNIIGRVNFGDGLLKIQVYELRSIWIMVAEHGHLEKYLIRKPKSIFQEIGFDPSRPIREQEPNPLPDRAALDNYFFEKLGLTQEERKEVYWAVGELVKNRLDKAASLKKRK